MGQLTGELAACAESLAFRRRLANIDPSNAQWRHDEACILYRIGNIYRDAGKNADAIVALAGEVAIWRELAEAAPRDRQRQAERRALALASRMNRRRSPRPRVRIVP